MLISVTTENLLWIWFKSLTVFLVYSIYRFTHNAIHPRFFGSGRTTNSIFNIFYCSKNGSSKNGILRFMIYE